MCFKIDSESVKVDGGELPCVNVKVVPAPYETLQLLTHKVFPQDRNHQYLHDSQTENTMVCKKRSNINSQAVNPKIKKLIGLSNTDNQDSEIISESRGHMKNIQQEDLQRRTFRTFKMRSRLIFLPVHITNCRTLV